MSEWRLMYEEQPPACQHLVPIPPGRMLDVQFCYSSSKPHDNQACLIQPPYPNIARAYERALQTYEGVLRELIQCSADSLAKAAVLDADLVSTMNIVAWEKFGIDLAQQERGLGLLWKLLGGNRRHLASLARNANILNRVGDHSAKTLCYVRTIQDTLEGMEEHLHELHLVASGAMVAEAAPPEVILRMLARGLERLGSARIGDSERQVLKLVDPL